MLTWANIKGLFLPPVSSLCHRRILSQTSCRSCDPKAWATVVQRSAHFEVHLSSLMLFDAAVLSQITAFTLVIVSVPAVRQLVIVGVGSYHVPNDVVTRTWTWIHVAVFVVRDTGCFHCGFVASTRGGLSSPFFLWLWASCRWCHRKPIRLQDADPPRGPVNELGYSICLWSSTLSLAGSPLPPAGWESVCGVMVSGV